MATSNKTRPSCARVKVEVFLLGQFPKRVNVGIKKKTCEIVSKWITIKYNYLPKYCRNCKLQGHNERSVLYYIRNYIQRRKGVRKPRKIRVKITTKRLIQCQKRRKMLTSTVNNFQEPRIKIGAKRGGYHDREGRIQRWNPKEKVSEDDLLITGNKFDALNEEEGTKEPSQQQENMMTIAMPKAGKSTKEKVVVATKD
ncbi:hypothetical protein KY284_010961 [Solanum tuberosum]|nr:hypothetical protein KY284_010961 [Solanum tuberosum]